MKKPCSPRHLLRSIPEGGPLLITARTLALVALLLALCSVVPSPADAAAPFTDVPEGHPYAVAIADLSTRGIISGFDDGTFRPGSSVTRQQFAKMIVRTLDYPIPAGIECPFTDVDPNPNPKDPLYPAKYVAVCALHGVTQGKTATTFDPYSGITRQQLIAMVARAAVPPEPPTEYTPPFAPAQFSLSDHYVKARMAACARLLDGLQGIGPGYDFLAEASRGECSQLLHNLLVFLAGPEPPTGNLMHGWFKPAIDWQNWQDEDVSQITGAGAVRAGIGGRNSYEPIPGSPYEHVFAISAAGDLFMFRVSRDRHDWGVTNVSAQTGRRVASLCDGDLQETGSGASTVLHLVARDFMGDLLHFWWKPGQDWDCENVSRLLDVRVTRRPTFFWDDSAPTGSEMTVGATGTNDHLLFFHLDGDGDWTLEDVTLQTEGLSDQGVTSSGFVRWDRPWGVIGANGHFYLLDRTSWTSPWQVTDVSVELGREFEPGQRLLKLDSRLPGMDQKEHYALVDRDHDFIRVWKDSGRIWHQENVSSQIGVKVSSLEQWWTRSQGASAGSLYLIGTTPAEELIAVWRDLPAGDWRAFDISEELGYRVFAWSIPAPTDSSGTKHVMLVRSE